jgi:hypothetical protein
LESLDLDGKITLEWILGKNKDSSVSIASDYRLDDWGSIPGGDWEFFPSPPRPDLLRGQPSLLF